MIIQYIPRFKKQYKKLTTKIQKQFDERIILFLEDPSNPILRTHPLKGSFNGYWSININGYLSYILKKR